jgi:translation initiation factor 2D
VASCRMKLSFTQQIHQVVQHSSSLQAHQLVSITEYVRDPKRIGPPLAVGRMAVDSDVLSQDGARGKAVFVLHAWKDHLFDMGHKGNPPDPWEMTHVAATNQHSVDEDRHDNTEEEQLPDPSVDALGSQLAQTQVDDPAPTADLTKEGALNYCNMFCIPYSW